MLHSLSLFCDYLYSYSGLLNNPTSPLQQQSAGSTTSPATGGMQGPGSQQMSTLPPSVASPNSLSMSQALESYQHVFTRVDMR